MRCESAGSTAPWAPEPVSSWTDAMAAARKCPLARSCSKGVAGSGCFGELRNATGTLSGVRGW